MKIFVSHSRTESRMADSITLALRSEGHVVFLDRDSLTAGSSYHRRIVRAVNESEIFIFLISPASVARGRYTLAELDFARKKWPDPNGCVLPVMARKTPLKRIPEYLKAVTILEPDGDPIALTIEAVRKMRKHSRNSSQAVVAVKLPNRKARDSDLIGHWDCKWIFSNKSPPIKDVVMIDRTSAERIWATGRTHGVGSYRLTGRISQSYLVTFFYEGIDETHRPLGGVVILELNAIRNKLSGYWYEYSDERKFVGGKTQWMKG
jgi:hypothetical protein